MLARLFQPFSNKTFGYLILARNINQNNGIPTTNDFKSVQIDVPWGKIEGKLWGSVDKQPMLALHGWQDNACTFDKLAPLLKNSCVLAIDLPGHGLSSWLPRGIPYNEDIMAESMRIIVKYFGWNKVKLLGHSMGGVLCFNYARLFPDETQFVISIDSLGFTSNNMTNHSQRRAKAIDKLINFEKKVSSHPPSYSEGVLVQKWIDATKFSNLDFSTAKILMTRGAKKKNDGTFYYTRDFRLNIEGFNACYTEDELKEMASLITCPYFVIRAAISPFPKDSNYWANVADILQETSSYFCLVDLNGAHHLHMMQPETVADAMCLFLEKHDI